MEAIMYGWLPPCVYPIYERLTGRRFWSLTQQLLTLQWRSPEALQERAETKLHPLLYHAYHHVPHYRRLFANAGITPDDVRSLKALCALPITSKHDLRARFPDGVVADNLPSQRRRFATTSGSSGIPFEFFTDTEARDMRAAAVDFFRILAGIKATDSHIAISSPREHPPRKPLQAHVRKLLTGSTSCYLSALDVTVASFARALDGVSGYYLQGYPSYIARLARQLEASALRLRAFPKVVVTDSETLTPPEAEQIASAFRCPVVVHYECYEFQSVAQSCPVNPQALHVNSEAIILEIVEEDGRLAPVGERGRVVITDLHNYVMPFIRYDIGDTAIAGEPCSCGRGLPTLHGLEGRSSEHIRTPLGKIITPGILGAIIFRQQGFLSYVAEYQAIQPTPDTVMLKVVPNQRFNHDAEVALHAALGRLLGHDMHVSLDLVDQIPREDNGKRLIIKSQLATRA
jgi:phenylacetate-CoA ligase